MRLGMLLMLVLAVPGWVHAEMRTWTSTDGKQIRAEILSATDTDVVLKLENGKEYTLPIKRLSVVDGTYVVRWQEKQASGDTGPAENWDAPWPTLISGEVSMEIITVEEDEAKKRFVYQSPNYEYVCDVKLGNNVVKRFAILFEATHDFVAALPLSMQKAHQKKRHLILLFEKKETYFANGAPANSAGVYMSGRDVIMVPLTSLGVIPSAGGYRVDYDKSNKTLPHEITHQLTDREYYAQGSMGWFTEGLAEYVGVTPYRSGKFNLRNSHVVFKDYVTKFGEEGKGGRNIGEHIKLPPIKSFMFQDYSNFLSNAQVNYGASLLLAQYFFHWDGEGDAANIKAFLKALKAGKSGEEAHQALLAGRTYEQLQEDISRAWGARGVKIEFK